MGDDINYQNLSIQGTPRCALGYQINMFTDKVNAVSRESSLHGLVEPGDTITHIRERGEKEWKELNKSLGDTDGPLGTLVDVKVMKKNAKEPVIYPAIRMPFIGAKDNTTQEKHVIRVPDFPGCEMLIGANDISEKETGLMTAQDTPSQNSRIALSRTYTV